MTRVTEQGRAMGGAYLRPNASQQLHKLEQDAYKAVLRAFKAQEVLTWGKERLMSDLRKELNISEELHLSFLSEIEVDEVPRNEQIILTTNFDQPVLSAPTPSKRLKITQPLPFCPPPSTKSKKNKGGPLHGRNAKAQLPSQTEGLNKLQQSSLEALIKEVNMLDEENDLAKIESIKRRAQEHEQMLMRALKEVGEVSDEGENAENKH